MTSFGAPRDVRGKHLKRIWEIGMLFKGKTHKNAL
jgi:hypothetical protein